MKKTFTLQNIVTFICLSAGLTVGAQTITVTSSADSGAGSLRQAVQDSNAGGIIFIAASLDGDDIDLSGTPILIDKSLTITGNGAAQTSIDGNGTSRIFTITNAGTVTISDLMLTNGAATDVGGAISAVNSTVVINNATISNSTADGDAATQGGGGIYSMGGTLTLNTCTVTGNEATGTSGSGGGILLGTGGTLNVVAGTINNNSANRAGGGIEGNSGAGTMITLVNVTLQANETGSSPGNGGGLHVTGAGNTTINGGTVTGNTAAAEGGGLWNGTGIMTIEGTTISNNIADGDGADQGGGGIYNLNGGNITITNATISNNQATGTLGSGGGILNDVGSMLTVIGTEISGNTAVRAGGGVEDNSGTSTLIFTNVEMTGNTVTGPPGNGGGLHITGGGSATFTGGLIDNNTASAEGGGLWNGTGTMTIDGTVLSNNTADGDGADQGGGGIYNLNGGTLSITNATISNNHATGTLGSGGGILNDVGSQLTVTATEISGNTAIRAGGGVEDNSGTSTLVFTNVEMNGNSVTGPPGNGGGLHITGAGNATFNGGTVSDNTASLQGGGLWVGSGTLTLNNVTVEDNTAAGAAATDGGGGIYNVSGNLNITNSTITGNNATGLAGSGGGIFSAAGNATIVNTPITGNSANRAGGGIEVIAGIYTINNADISNNDVDGTAGAPNPGNGGGVHISGASTFVLNGGKVNNNDARREGGGLWNQTGSTMVVNNITLTGNTASGPAEDDGGGAIFNNGGTLNVNASTLSGNTADGLLGTGGGLHVNTGTATIMLSTLSGNSSLSTGGGIYNNAALTVNANTITLNSALGNGGGIYNNSATAPVVKNSIVAGNLAVLGSPDVFSDDVAIISAGFNLIGVGNTDDFTAVNSDITGTALNPANANLMPLANNGGATFTHALDCPSAAADMGEIADVFADQTGQPVFNGRRDIGAYEAQEACSLATQDFAASQRSMLYPNPSQNGLFNVRLAAQNTAATNITIYEIGSGKLVKTIGADAPETQVNMTGFATGTYVVKIVSDKATETHKLVIAN